MICYAAMCPTHVEGALLEYLNYILVNICHSCSVCYKLVMGTLLLYVNALKIHFCILDIKFSFSLFVFIFTTC